MKYNGENHMVVGNKDPKPLRCPNCGELATGQFVEDISLCAFTNKKVTSELCFACSENNNCANYIGAFECVCGCIFNEEGKIK